MTKFKDGSFTNFVPKIQASINDDTFTILPKHHTIRRSGRVKKGMKLSMRIWTGVPYRSAQDEFAKGECTGTQKIHIWQDHFGGRHVVIDEKMLTDDEIVKLAINDGFDNINQFFSWFGWEFEGTIIHWAGIMY